MIRLGKKYQLLLQKSREMNCSLLREDSTEGGRKKSQLGSSWGLERTKSRAFFLPEWALPFPSRKAVFLYCDLGFARLPLDSAILDLSSGLCTGVGVRVTRNIRVGFFGFSKIRVLKIETRKLLGKKKNQQFGYP